MPVLFNSQLPRRGPAAAFVVAAILAFVAAFDYLTGPSLNLSVAYFLPIIYTAWAFGRNLALLVAVVAEIPTYLDQLSLVEAGLQSAAVATSTIAVRLLVYLFVAEVTARLVKSNDELKKIYMWLEEDLKAAGALQESMLPFSPPSLPGCEIGACVRYAGRTGGDFADTGIIDRRGYVCIADISGKGTPAALFTTLLKHLIDDGHRRGLRGERLVAALNTALCRNLPPEKFITLFYAEINPDSGNVEYVNAGHLEGLVYRRESDELEMAGPTAPILGLSEDSFPTTTATIALKPGDALVLYSDGATESKTLGGERLGDDLIRRLVIEHAHAGAQEMAESVCRAIEAEVDEAARDDLAIVTVKIARSKPDTRSSQG
jgi:serine phosphatase RsbU (regulator of sigma subunit)